MKRITDIIQIIIICALTLAFAVGFWVIPDREFSDKENRSLESFPTFTMKKDSSGSWQFTSKIGTYYADQFPLRDTFVGMKAYSELALARLENNGVVAGKQHTLIPHPSADEKTLKKNLHSISVYKKAKDIPVTVACLPRPCDVFADRLPAVYDTEADAKIWSVYDEQSEELALSRIDMYSLLGESKAYYRTDHHYTTDGAYEVYCALADALGYTPYGKEFFDRTVVADDFDGTSMRTSGLYLTQKDEIALYRYDGDENYTVIADGEKISLYDFEKLSSTDKYAVFLGGNHSRVDITSGEQRKRLLLIRDSYADALAPFLALHFDLTMIDPRYYQKSVQSECDCDAALILMSMAELADGVSLGYLEMP